MLIIAVNGGSASGKTSFCYKLMERIKKHGISVSVLSQDSFYKNLPHDVDPANYNFDEPVALDFDLMKKKIMELKSDMDDIEIPDYDFKTHQAIGTIKLKKCEVLIIEGILIFSQKEIYELADVKVFIKASPELRFARRIKRDVVDRGRNIDFVINSYLRFAVPSYNRYIAPNESNADFTIHNDTNDGDHTLVSKIKIIESHIMQHLNDK